VEILLAIPKQTLDERRQILAAKLLLYFAENKEVKTPAHISSCAL